MQKLPFYILVLITYFGFAQTPITYTTKNGLPSNLVYDMVEDGEGFMWFATNRGLAKFDGDKFKVFTTKEGLSNNDIWLLETDAQGRVWFFSKSKYQGYMENDKVHLLKTANNEVINPVYVDKNYDPFIIVAGSVFEPVDSMLKIRDDTVKNQNFLLNNIKGYNTDTYQVFINLGTEMPSFYLKKNKLITLDEDLKVLNSFNITHEKTQRTSRSSIYATAHNKMIYCYNKGVVYFNQKTNTAKSYTLSADELSRNNRVNRIYLTESEIQLSLNGYNYLFDKDFNLTQRIDVKQQVPTIKKSFIDSRGHLWVITDKGVQLIPKAYQDLVVNFVDGSVHNLANINGSLIAGRNNQGYHTYDTKSQSFSNSPFIKQSNNAYLITNSTNTLAYLPENESLYKYDGTAISESILSFYYYDNNIKATTSILKDYIAVNDSVSYLIQSAQLLKGNLSTNNAKILIDKTGLFKFQLYKQKLFVGGSDGLHELKQDSLYKLTPQNEIAGASVLNMVSTESEIFVATDGNGVYQYIPEIEKVTFLKNTVGLSVQNMILDKDTLWLATQRGVKKLLLNQNQISNSKIVDQFYLADGLLDDNVNDFLKLGDKMMVATEEGVSTIDVSNKNASTTPVLYIEHPEEALERFYSKDENISVAFGAIDFSNQEYLSFSYRLLPLQTAWTETSSKSITFLNLAPGDYSLEIKAINQHFVEGKTTFPIIIKPLWYQTNLAKALFVLLGVLALLGFTFMVKKTIRKSEQKRNEQDKRVAGLELQALRSQMNPHFVHNSLNAIQYYIQRNEVELSENYLSKFSKLIRMFFEYSRRDSIKLIEEIELITHYLQIEKLRFEDKLSFKIDVDANIDIEEQHIPSMILQPILENAVNHGIFHKPEAGNVYVSFKALTQGYQITIEDDGIGINKAKEIYKNSAKNYQSKSSAVLQERLELLSQSNNWDIVYTMVDLADISEGEGTRVTLVFKTDIT